MGSRRHWTVFQIVTMMVATWSGVAWADELTGTVRTSGSGMETRTQLIKTGESSGQSLCSNGVEKKLRRLGAMTVEAQGEWRVDAKGEKQCFDASDFRIRKMSSGRKAVVGVVSKKDGLIVVTADDGKTRILDDVPSGLRKMEGKKVILDLKQLSSPSATGEVYRVVTYALHP